MNLDRRLLDQLRSVRSWLILTVVLGLLAGLLLVLQAHYLSQTVSRVFLDGQGLRDVRSLLIALGIAAAVRAAALWGGEVAAHHVAGRIKTELRERLFAHLIALGPAFTRGERTGELVTTAVQGIEELDAYFSQYIPQLVLSVLIPVAMLAVVFPLDLLSGVVLLVTAPMIPFFMLLIGSLASVQARKQWTQLSRMSAHFLDVLQGLTTLKILGRSREQAQVIARISDQFRDATMSVLRIAFLSALALEMLATISTAIIAVEIGLRLLYGRIAFDQAFFVLILAPEYYLPLRLLGTRFHAGVSGVAAAGRIFEVLETPTPLTSLPVPHSDRVGEGDSGGEISSPVVSLRGERGQEVTFEDIHYAYAGGERPALNGVTFAIPPGQKTALVGPSGAGKSTVVQLLLRFVAPTAGRITAGGVPLGHIPADEWRAQIAWVPQLPYLFAGSVADNIRLARPDAPLDDAIRAAQLAHADAFVRELPAGYDTPIGERGARLSGGQAQRIAIARAFLKDAPLLILDEATSNLDPDTEALIQDAIRSLMRGRTVLIVAHRLRTGMDSDHIVVLDGGRVVEVGTHAALLARDGLYSRLVAARNDSGDSL
jgi:ATP-binding cassette subfamily C protein CydD